METARDTATAIAPFVGQSGTCESEFPLLLSAINDIRRLLWNKLDYSSLMEWVDICCVKSCFFIPARYEVVRYAKVCGMPIQIQNEWFQITRPDSDSVYDLLPSINVIEDIGAPDCKFREYITAPYQLQAYSENTLDMGTVLQFQVRNKFGRWSDQQITLGSAFEKITLPEPIVTFNRFSKPVTNGAVRLYAFDALNDLNQLLGIYQPWEKNPMYKKYTAPGCRANTIRVKAKLKRQDLKGELDLVEFPEDCMILAAQAITYRKDKDNQNYNSTLAQAIAELQQEMQSNQTHGSTPLKIQTQDYNPSLIGEGYGW